MAIKTTEQQLEEVQAAITAVLANQSYSLDGLTVTRADLAALQTREDKLLARYNAEQGKRPRVLWAGVSGMGYADGASLHGGANG